MTSIQNGQRKIRRSVRIRRSVMTIQPQTVQMKILRNVANTATSLMTNGKPQEWKVMKPLE